MFWNGDSTGKAGFAQTFENAWFFATSRVPSKFDCMKTPLLTLALLDLLLLICPADAEENRLSRLTDSGLLSNITVSGEWSVQVSDTHLDYTCLQCEGAITAKLEIIGRYPAESYASPQKRYLAGRTQFCANLAISMEGRCVGTTSADLRGGGLPGYVSESIAANGREIEIVMFYSEGGGAGYI